MTSLDSDVSDSDDSSDSDMDADDTDDDVTKPMETDAMEEEVASDDVEVKTDKIGDIREDTTKEQLDFASISALDFSWIQSKT